MEEWQDRLLHAARQGSNTWEFVGFYILIENRHNLSHDQALKAVNTACRKMKIRKNDRPTPGKKLSLFKEHLISVLKSAQTQ